MAVPKTAALPLGYIPARIRETHTMYRNHGHATKINIADLFPAQPLFHFIYSEKDITAIIFYIYHRDSNQRLSTPCYKHPSLKQQANNQSQHFIKEILIHKKN
jgi:hypothetical protein